MNWNIISAIVGILIVLVMFVVMSMRDESNTRIATSLDGKALYLQNCASCHGANLEGQSNWRRRKPDGRLPAPPHDDTGHTWHHSDKLLFKITKLGTEAIVGGDYKSDMPGFGDTLSDDEINAVLGFIKSRWPEKIRRRDEQMRKRDSENEQ